MLLWVEAADSTADSVAAPNAYYPMSVLMVRSWAVLAIGTGTGPQEGATMTCRCHSTKVRGRAAAGEGWGLPAELGCLHTGGGAGRVTWWQMLCAAIRLPGKTLCECGRLQDGAGHVVGARPLPVFCLLDVLLLPCSLARSCALCSCPSTSHGSGCRERCLVHSAAAPAAPADLGTLPVGGARAAFAPRTHP